MRIGELARHAGVHVDTVRYYEREGLLPPAPRRESGYRMYEREDLKRLRFVRRAKTLGFTLTEIRGLLQVSTRHDEDMAGMKAAAVEKLAAVDAKLAELGRMRAALAKLAAACPGQGSLVQCPILDALSGDEP